MKGIHLVNSILVLVSTLTAFGNGASFGSAEINGKQARDLMFGGEDSEPGEFPFIAQVRDVHPMFETTHECAAVIIDENHLITSGQCIHSVHLRDLEIVAGLYNMSDYTETRQQLRKLSRAQKHPDYYTHPYLNDIAVLTLQDPLIFNEYVQPIRIPVTTSAAEPSEPCVTLGLDVFGTNH